MFQKIMQNRKLQSALVLGGLNLICFSPSFANESMTSHNHSSIEVVQSEGAFLEASTNQSKASIWPELSFVGGYKEENFQLEPKKGAVAYLNLDWNLFDGGRTFASWSQAQGMSKVHKISTERKKRELYLQFFKLKRQQQKLENLAKIEQQEVQFYSNQLLAAKKRVNSGLTTEADILELEIQQQETQEHILEMNQELKQIALQLASMGGAVSEAQFSYQTLDLNNPNFENSLISQELNLQLEVAESARMGAYSAILPRLDFNAKYGVVDPQDYSNASRKETAVSLLLTIPLFSGGKNLASVDAAKYDFYVKDHRLRMELKGKKAEFEIKLARRQELSRLIEVHKSLAERTERLMSLVTQEFKRGVKGSSEWMDATEKWVDVRKKLIDFEFEKDLLDLEIRML